LGFIRCHFLQVILQFYFYMSRMLMLHTMHYLCMLLTEEEFVVC
jgi:hypothetical protein